MFCFVHVGSFISSRNDNDVDDDEDADVEGSSEGPLEI